MRPYTTYLAAVSLLGSLSSTSSTRSEAQLPFLTAANNADTLSRTSSRVYGSNNATYGPVPKEEQLFQIEFLEIAPSPFEVDRVVFAWLRGYIGNPATPITDSDLAAATLSITASANYRDGTSDEPETHTIPLQTTAHMDLMHLAIRDSEGLHVDHLTVGGSNDILLDIWVLGMFIRKGDWTIAFAAELEDGRNLFALTLTQYIEGALREPATAF